MPTLHADPSADYEAETDTKIPCVTAKIPQSVTLRLQQHSVTAPDSDQTASQGTEQPAARRHKFKPGLSCLSCGTKNAADLEVDPYSSPREGFAKALRPCTREVKGFPTTTVSAVVMEKALTFEPPEDKELRGFGG
jgi:hypothetical protein